MGAKTPFASGKTSLDNGTINHQKAKVKRQQVSSLDENGHERSTKKAKPGSSSADNVQADRTEPSEHQRDDSSWQPALHAANGLPIADCSPENEQKESLPGNSGSSDSEAAKQLSPGIRGDSKVLSRRKLQRFKEQSERRGIVYVSRIPPHMKPQKLRQLLSQHGEVNRVYCAAEDDAVRKARKKRGGNTGKNFTEGWVEFEDKRVAKRVALMLSGQQMGGSKRSAYHYDLWCLKYLPKFKWDHLTEQIRFERAVREQKLAAEVAAAKRERDFYLSRVDKAKAINAIVQRKQDQQGRKDEKPESTEVHAPREPAGSAEEGRDIDGRKLLRVYGQKRVKADPVTGSRAPLVSDDVLALLAPKRARHEQAS